MFKALNKVHKAFTTQKNSVTFFFKNKDNSMTKVSANVGQNLLQIAHKNEIDLEGACE